MTRLFGPRILAALALAISLAACNSVPLATLKDPAEIGGRAAAAIRAAKAIHARVSASGPFLYADGRLAIGAGPGSFRLDGTTGQAWLDTRTDNARVTFDAPGFADSSGEIIRVGSDIFVKAAGGAQLLTGQMGDKYVRYSLASAPVSVPSSRAVVDQLAALLEAPGVVLLGIEKKNGRDSYHIRATVPKSELAKLSASGLDLGAVVVEVWIALDNQQVTHVEVTANGDAASVTISADLDYPGSVNIKAPSADRVTSGAGLP